MLDLLQLLEGRAVPRNGAHSLLNDLERLHALFELEQTLGQISPDREGVRVRVAEGLPQYLKSTPGALERR